LHLPQHGVDAEDSGPLQDFRVRDPVLPSQLQCSTEESEMEVIQPPGLVRVDSLGFRSVKECRQDNGLVDLQFCVQVNTVAILHGGLQPAEGLTGFVDPLNNLVIDSHAGLQPAS
uniref:Interleukin-1 receptor n=1 Tax=Schistocephalus solidus TaxID=70667 RepID=A0A183T7C3_SCHSO